jgi:diamine N-acetyltransferase
MLKENFALYLRPLQLEDAQVSWQWRNNPKLWRFTGSKPDKFITPEMETEWLASVLQRPDEKRFAIVMKENEKYIGNIFLTGIKDGVAEHHIFIGETDYWGKGRPAQASYLILEYAFQQLGLHTVYIITNKRNLPALAIANGLGWQEVGDEGDTHVKHIYTSSLFWENHQNGLLQQHFEKLAAKALR